MGHSYQLLVTYSCLIPSPCAIVVAQNINYAAAFYGFLTILYFVNFKQA